MYTTKAKIENLLMTDINTAFDSQINDWISAAEEYINNYTGRTFGPTTTTKYFNGSGSNEQYIDSFTGSLTIQIIESNGTDVEYTLTEGVESDYITYPYNDTTKFKLIMTTSAQIGYWPKGDKRIKITGNFGTGSTVPKSIELATTKMVADVIKPGLKGGVIASESLGDYSVTFDNIFDDTSLGLEIKQILNQYKIFEL
jgi:hypothetical protein